MLVSGAQHEMVTVTEADDISGLVARPGVSSSVTKLPGDIRRFNLNEVWFACFDDDDSAQAFADELKKAAPNWPGDIRATSITEVPGFEDCDPVPVVVWD